jgi:putative ABC transport system permease protein
MSEGGERLRRLFHLRTWGPAVREGVDWELAHHLEERIDELVAAGHTPVAAREEALRTFGDLARVRGELLALDERSERRRTMTRWLDDLWQDVRYGARALRRHPGIAAGVVLTLGLGIGASAALFSMVDALVLRPLPFERPDELVDVFVATPQHEYSRPIVPFEVARGWQEAQDVPVLLHTRQNVLYTGGSEAMNLPVQAVSPEFGEVFGVAPVRGRAFLPEDALPGAPDVALIDQGFWRRELGADEGVLGTTLVLNGVPHTVIGVMPPRFRYPLYSTTDAWVPLRTDGTVIGQQARNIEVVMRVLAERHAALAAQASALGGALFRATNPASESALSLRVMGWQREPGEELKRALVLLGGAVALILLVAGVNMVNLLLARGATRTSEIAVRMAVGASRGRLVRQIATEAMLLALLGGAAAALLAFVVVRALADMMPASLVFFAPFDIMIEQRALVFTFVVAAASGLVFGMLPALATTGWAKPAARAGLSRYAARTPGKRRLRRGLVVSEVAFSVMLLVTAGLLINSFIRLMRVDPGMRMDDLAVLTFFIPSTTYPTAEHRIAYLRRLEERIGAVPGVQAVALTGGLPPRGGGFHIGVALEAEGREPIVGEELQYLPMTSIGPSFFDVTGARLLAGRNFTERDDYESGHVIVDEDLARYLFPGESAVGRRFRIGPDADWLTIVGVTADLKLSGPQDRLGELALFYPTGSGDLSGQVAIAIRTRGDPRPLLAPIRRAVRDIDPNQPVWELATARAYWAEAVDLPRFLATMIGTLAALALALAAVGIHGVLAFTVAERRHELGVRTVLGARAGQLARLVVGEGMMLAAMGAALGVAGALLATRVVRGALFGVEPVDAPTFVVVLVAVLLVAAAATGRPAWRATRVQPMDVLREG